ncbi:alpha/beta hydrolase [Rathayibacter sp. SD072]|nr:alpha/beta hydrolase [Rathayibacter sp. SD072]
MRDQSVTGPQQLEGYTFALDEGITRTPVRYLNRYGITLAGDLYYGADLDTSQSHQAIVIGPPHGGVKEQGAGIYGQELARRGFVALAFDPSHNGESSGSPRHLTSPELFAEDFSAGVDLLGSLPFVDREQIGAIGICGSGGFVLSQASVDPRIKAVATSAMYDISGAVRDGWQHAGTDADRRAMLDMVAAQRWSDLDLDEPVRMGDFPAETPPEGAPDANTAEFWEYYMTERGEHPRSVGGFTINSYASHVNFGALRNIADIAPRNILLITGDIAHSKWFSDEALEKSGGRAEFVVVPGARHIDLYDRTDLIPFDTLERFFRENLASSAA